jgi:hypothetical protein
MKYAILTLMLLTGFACAYDVTFLVNDFNTQQPIMGANITINDASTYIITDESGLALKDGLSGDTYYNISRLGYYPLIDGLAEVTEDTSIVYYMTPISDDGIVRIRIFDDNPVHHKVCFFYDNGRLQDCYNTGNTTIKLIVNHNYEMIPETGFIDNMNTPESLYNYLLRLSSWLLGLFIVFALIYLLLRR